MGKRTGMRMDWRVGWIEEQKSQLLSSNSSTKPESVPSTSHDAMAIITACDTISASNLSKYSRLHKEPITMSTRFASR